MDYCVGSAGIGGGEGGAIMVGPGWEQLVEGRQGLNIAFVLFNLIFLLKLFII